MSDFDPTKCVLHEAAISEMKDDIKEVKGKLFGNGQKGLTYIVERNSVYLRIIFFLSATNLSAMGALMFKVFGA
jgi:hypothetical protein